MANLIFSNSTPVLNSTEWCVFKTRLPLEDFVIEKIRVLYDRIISDTLTNCLNINEKVEKSLYSNTTKIVKELGLKDIIINSFIYQKEIQIKVELVNDSVIYSQLEYKPNNDKDNNILIINGKNAPTNLLYDYFTMIFFYNQFTNSVLTLANKPLIKFNELRSQHGNLAESDNIRKQVQESLKQLKRENGFGILDAKDDVDMFTIDISHYESIIDKSYIGIADIMGMSLSYFTGMMNGTLSNIGEGDRIKNQDGFYRFYKNTLQNILMRIYEILMLQYDIKYKEYLEYKFKNILPVLTALERTTLLTEEQKQQYVTQLME